MVMRTPSRLFATAYSDLFRCPALARRQKKRLRREPGTTDHSNASKSACRRGMAGLHLSRQVKSRRVCGGANGNIPIRFLPSLRYLYRASVQSANTTGRVQMQKIVFLALLVFSLSCVAQSPAKKPTPAKGKAYYYMKA